MTGTMRDKDTISKGPKRRDETCYQTQYEIVIPKGTILRARGKDEFGADVGVGARFTIGQDAASERPSIFKRVIA